MDKKRSSEQIDGELQTLRAKIRDLEGQRQEKQKAVERAKRQRTQHAFAANADGNKQAAEQLAKAREIQVKAALELEDFESAIAEGRARFDALQAEHERAYQAEQWAALMAEADELVQKEAVQLDVHATAMVKLLSEHAERLNHLKSGAHNLGFPRCFGTVGLRHFDRVFAWRMIQAGFAGEYEKPSEQYRKASGYADILAEQIAAAVSAHDQKMKEHEADGQAAESEADGNDHDHEAQGGAESEGTQA